MFKLILFFLAFAVAVYTQVAQLTSVPGLHFDEAWQGMYAYRIASETGFFPLSAMNSYTSPLIHYLLAGSFKLFGPSLLVMRGSFAAMNLLALTLIATLLWRARERVAMIWFTLFWGLLPLSVHIHRFYVEMTGFFSICLAVMLWGLFLWKSRPFVSALLLILAVLAGSYSHILFVASFAGAIYVGAQYYPSEFRSTRGRTLIAFIAFALVPLAVRMGIGLNKPLPFLLAAAFLCFGIIALLAQTLWEKLSRIAIRSNRWLVLACIPFLIGYVGLMWNGNWPYAQATGYLAWAWLPVNFVGFLILALRQLRLIQDEPEQGTRPPREKFILTPTIFWHGFLVTFFVSSLLIFKQSPRYYTVPSILAMLWISLRLARAKHQNLVYSFALIFVSWNFWAFRANYLTRFNSLGPTTNEFHAAIYHDNSRDFRPFQKVMNWLTANNCQHILEWVEDDRFLFPYRFLQLTAPAAQGTCPWSKEQLFFSHIENYDEKVLEPRTEFNTAPPSYAPHVKLLAHFPEWGDLAVWIRK
jgi:hypothetical protein